jgi:hypothetical protein
MMTSLAAAVPSTPGLYEAVLGKPFTPTALLKVLDAHVARESLRSSETSRERSEG